MRCRPRRREVDGANLHGQEKSATVEWGTAYSSVVYTISDSVLGNEVNDFME
jgi:hypothetical protein